MKTKIISIFTIFMFVFSYGQDKFEPTWESLDQRETPAWLSDSKFGIFIHWGLYSVPGYTNKGTYAEWYWNALNEDPNTAKKNIEESVTRYH